MKKLKLKNKKETFYFIWTIAAVIANAYYTFVPNNGIFLINAIMTVVCAWVGWHKYFK